MWGIVIVGFCIYWYNPSATPKMSWVSNQWCATGTPAVPGVVLQTQENPSGLAIYKYLKAKERRRIMGIF
jgi:hypothetical protein